MSTLLPAAVAGYLRAASASDAAAIISCFTDDAEVTDEGRTWSGHDEIRQWWEGPATKYEYTVRVLGGQSVAGDRYVVRTRLTGNFPGGTVDLRYRFTLRDGLISVLKIAP
jgi:ketosteroid isomerase-like protein